MLSLNVVCVVFALTAPQVPPPPPPPAPPIRAQRDPATVKKGTSIIKGHVFTAEGRPLRRAQIRASDGDPRDAVTTTTGLEGEYELRELPAGRYTVHATRGGYLPAQHGQRGYGEPGAPVEIAEAATVEKIDFVLARAGVVSGRVTDETGDPAAGVDIRAMRLQVFRGRKRIVPVFTSVVHVYTDDTGQYRLTDLPPGEYFIAGRLRDTWMSDEKEPQMLSYAPSYFPGTANLSDARRVKIVSGQEAVAIDFALAPMRAASLSGTVVAADGAPLSSGRIVLSQELLGPAGGTTSFAGNAVIGADGTWRLREVPPGEYLIRATGSAGDRPSEMAVMPVDVQGLDIDGLIVTADSGGLISGRVVTDTGEPLPFSSSRPTIATTPVSMESGMSRPTPGQDDGVVAADGRFTRRSMSGPVVIRTLLALTLAQAVVPGMSKPRADTNPKATAVIKGRITAADTGRPLRRARVTVSGEPLTTPRSTSTNVRGEYELKDLPAGRYQLRVQRSGYLPMQYGQRRSTEPARPIDVAEGQAFDKMDFALPRTGIISGRVIDETGESVAGVGVWTMRQEYFRGRRRLVPAGPEAKTDDTGQYRILNVPPGEYLVMATLRETWVAGPERQPFGYAPTFFPGMARAADATRLKVAIGQEVPNTDFALVAARAAELAGTATSADGAPLAGARVSLSFDLIGPSGGMFMGVSSATVAADGSWSIRNIPPGEYQLEVSSQERDRSPARAFRTVQMQGADLHGIALVADSGGTITGQVVTDTGEALPAAASRMRVMAESLAPDQRATGILMGDDNGLVGVDGRFTLTGVLGRSAVRVSALPRGWVLKSVEADDRDYAEAPIELRGGQTLDARIVITDRFPAITGRVTDARGNPVEGTVLMFPSDTARWFDNTMLRMARPDQSGVFRMETVRPGDYLAVALESVESWQINDPEFLEQLRSRATRVTIREGQPEVLSLRVGGSR